MVANPSIASVIATKSATVTTALVFIENTAFTNGMVKALLHEYLGGVCDTTQYAIAASCVPVTQNSYISGLRYLYELSMPFLTNYVCARTYQCISGENCSANTCTTYNTSYYQSRSNVFVDYGLGNTPSAVSNMTKTEGDTYTIIKWTPPSNAPVTYYEVQLMQGSTIYAGWLYTLYSTSGGINVMNLKNGTTYRLYVRPISDDGYIGNSNYIDFTPIEPPPSCTTPICSFSVI